MQFYLYSAGAVSTSDCWQQEPQHPPPVPPVNARMLAAAVTLNAIRAKRMPTCLIIIPPKYEATPKHIGKQSGIF